MRPRSVQTFCAAAALLSLALMATACGTDAPKPAAKADGAVIVRSFAGAIEGTDAYLAVLSAGSTTLAYLCDGANEATWFAGTATPDTLSVQSARGDRIELKAEQARVVGKLTIGGKNQAIALDGVATPSGLYVLAPHLSNDTLTTYLGGWIVLPDGSVKGAVRSRGAVVANPAPDLKANTVTLPNGETVAVVPFGGGGGSGGGFQLQFQFGGQLGGTGGGQLGQLGQFGGGQGSAQFGQFGSQFGQFGAQAGGQFGQLGGQFRG